jgi:hypothetical protein
MHEMLIGNVENGRVVPGFGRRFVSRDLIFPVAALTPEFKSLDPIVNSREVLRQHRAPTVNPWTLDGIFLKRFEE